MFHKPDLVAGLDAGSARTRFVVCELDQGYLRYVSHGEAPSQGWHKGRITDAALVSRSIVAAVEQAEGGTPLSLSATVIGIGGPTIAGAGHHGLYEFGRQRPLEGAELGYAVERASRVRLDDDRAVVHVAPQDFIVDGRAGHRNPRGALCARLEANVLVVTASDLEHRSLTQAVHSAHLEIAESVFEPVAAAYAAILPEARRRGVALIDIGAHSTGFVVYDGDSLTAASSLPIGGDHFTRDVAWGLCVSFEDAQALIQEYGCALLGLTADNSYIELPTARGRQPREAMRKELNQILEARAEELFDCVLTELRRIHIEQSLMEGVTLCGGMALLSGMCDVAERVFNVQSCLGLPCGIEDWPDAINNAAWTTAAGLAMYAARLRMRKESRKAPGLLNLVFR